MKYQELLNLANGQAPLTAKDLYLRRQQAIKDIEQITKRPLILYAAKIESPHGSPNTINLEDVVGFSDLIADVEGDNLDIFIESPGGIVDAADRIVYILRQRFKNIRFLVPGSAYSAATMLCLSGDEILMDERGCLGPIDPQIGGIPARSILNGFEAVRKILEEKGATALPAYLPLLQKYDLHIFEICKDAEDRGKKLVEQWLKTYMFAKDKKASKKIKGIVKYFSDYNNHKSHSRPIFYSDAKSLGLNVTTSAGDLKKAIWKLYLEVKFHFDVLPQVKIFENGHGVNWGKNFEVRFLGPQPQFMQIPIVQPPSAPRSQ